MSIKQNITSLQSLLEQVNALPEAGVEPVLQSKFASPATNAQIIRPDSGYDGLSQVTINAMPTAEQATPSISVSTGGLITATSTQSTGYVVGDIKSATKQLTTKSAQTYTPTTTNQTIASGRYLTGTQTIKGDANLVAENIKSGITIFNILGTFEGANDPNITYRVVPLGNATYGFELNDDGYYESQNKGKTNSYAICRIHLNIKQSCDVIFDVINYGEAGYDYGIFGNLNSPLTLSTTADSSSKKKFSTSADSSVNVVNLTYSGVSAGDHYIDVKFIKDGSGNNGNDSIQFKIQNAVEKSADSELPIGHVTHLASGEYIPTENSISRVDVNHDLGVTPNFLILILENSTSANPLTSALTGAAVFYKDTKYNSSSTIMWRTHILMEGYSGGVSQGTATRADSTAYFTSSTFGIPCNSTYPLVTGYSYRWVCGVLDGIL